MGSPRRALLTLAVAAAVAAGCVPPTARPAVTASKKPATPRSAGSARPAIDPGTAGPLAALRVQGEVRLLSNNGGGIISDNGGGIISNNSGAIISDNGGGLISDKGGSLVSNNGGGLVAKTKYALAQAKPAEFRLADARLTVHDAAGRPVHGKDGQPIATTTDKAGKYVLDAELPAGNLELRIQLWQGGTLSAILPRGAGAARTVDVDTASSIGARYVLDRFVKGDQAVYDKLPAAEAERLRKDLRAAQAGLATAPKYDAAELVALGDDLRGRDAAVDRTLTDIQALLLGQANLGAGRPADEVPLAGPRSLAIDAAGRLLIGERGPGRIRVLGADGRLATYADTAFGEVRRNFFDIREMAVGPDGRAFVFYQGGFAAIARDGVVTELPRHQGVVTGIGAGLVAMPDGVLVAGGLPVDTIKAMAPDGTVKDVPFDGKGARVVALAPGPGGTLYVAAETADAVEVWKGTLAGVATKVAEGLPEDGDTELAVAADGTVYLASEAAGGVIAIAPDGARRRLTGETGAPGTGGPAEPGAPSILRPIALLAAPDGTLYAADDATAFVHARSPDGRWRQLAGSHARIQDLAKGEVAVNTPGGVAVDAEGGVLFAEVGSSTVKRFDGRSIATVAGTVLGLAGDGGPAAAARLAFPRAVAHRAGATLVMDSGNARLRRIGADGRIETLAGRRDKDLPEDLQPGQAYPPDQVRLDFVSAVAFDGEGRPIWTSERQVVRLDADGKVRVLVGRASAEGAPPFDLGAILGMAFPAAGPDTALTFALGLATAPNGDVYVADAAQGRIYRVREAAGGGVAVTPFAGISITDVIAKADSKEQVPAEGDDPLGLALIGPMGLGFDPAGNLYVTEVGTRALLSTAEALGSKFPMDPATIGDYPARVRKITPAGRVTTIAGPGGRFFQDPNAADGLVGPAGIVYTPDGRLVIVDSAANLIRVLPAGSF